MVCLWAHHDSERNFINYFYITVCLQRAGEILPDKTAIEENNDDKFGQLMRNKTVHLLAFFLMVYIGVEVTIGGIIFGDYLIVKSLITPKIRMDCNIPDARSWRWAFDRLRFDRILRW